MPLVEQHPVQVPMKHRHAGAKAPKVVTMRAYEAYCQIWGRQDAIVNGDCRGGFSVQELVGLLYARSFPAPEWHDRFYEAIEGLDL